MVAGQEAAVKTNRTGLPEFSSGRENLPRVWAAYAAAAWAAAYLLSMHLPILVLRHPLLPWPDDPRPGSGMPSALTEVAVIVMLIGAGGVGLALARPWGRAVPRWLLLGIAWTGGALGVAHWAIWSAQAALRRINGFHAPPPAGVTVEAWHAYAHDLDVLNLLLYEPWFLVMGILLALAAWQNIRRTHALTRLAAQNGSPTSPAPPAWMIKNGWSSAALVPWSVAAVGVQIFWAINQDHSWMRVSCLVGALLCAAAAILGQVVRSGQGVRLSRILSGVLTLGGLAVLLFGITSFDPWIFAFYGPGLMAGGLLVELAGWPTRLRAGAGNAERSGTSSGVR